MREGRERQTGYTKGAGETGTRGDQCRCRRVLNATARRSRGIKRGYKGTEGASREGRGESDLAVTRRENRSREKGRDGWSEVTRDEG
jgi:hypothetical protein